MFRTAITLGVMGLMIPTFGFSATLTMQPSGKEIEKVAIAKTAVTSIDGRSANLSLAGAGIRKKTLFNVKVYVAQLLVDQIDKYTRNEDQALDSTNQMGSVAVHLTFLRNVGAEDVMNAYLDSLDANDVDTKSEEVKAFLNAVKKGGDAPEGKSMAIVGERLANGSELVTYESPTGAVTTIQGKAGFVRSILSIWLGEMTDSHLEDLKKDLVKGVQ
ncbi:MAG: chalcone isomerase family protein [Oligoflexia bacterium]|nr:chalcone isomerase family protein [Oligoflexia bacterium]